MTTQSFENAREGKCCMNTYSKHVFGFEEIKVDIEWVDPTWRGVWLRGELGWVRPWGGIFPKFRVTPIRWNQEDGVILDSRNLGPLRCAWWWGRWSFGVGGQQRQDSFTSRQWVMVLQASRASIESLGGVVCGADGVRRQQGSEAAMQGEEPWTCARARSS